MKSLIQFFALALIFVLGGCSEMTDMPPVSPDQQKTLLSKDSQVPFNTTYFGTAQITPTGPYSASSVMEGRGNATHVGFYTSTSQNDLVYTSATGGSIVNGTHTTFAANGDEMYATYTGTFSIENGIVTNRINFIFNGGTGRFLNLYGEIQIVVTTDDAGQLTQDLSGSGSGYIRY